MKLPWVEYAVPCRFGRFCIFQWLKYCVSLLTGPLSPCSSSLCLLLPFMQHASWFLWLAQLMGEFCQFQITHFIHLTDYLLILSISDYCEFLSVQISLTDASSKEEKRKKMLFCYQTCSHLLWEKSVLVIKKKFWGWRQRICKFFEITRSIYSNSERSVQFLKQNAFLTCSCRFLRSNTLEQF